MLDKDIEQTIASLHSRHINGIFARNSQEARVIILSLIPAGAIVGIGDSTAIRQLGIPQVLKKRGIKVLDAFEPHVTTIDPKDAQVNHDKTIIEATISDVFLTGTNAITQDGRLVNMGAMRVCLR